MDKKRIGIPRGIYYEEYGRLYKSFFQKLNFDIVESIPTNQEILELGNHYATSEMCLSLKITLGHIAYLQDKCDMIVVPRIDNFGIDNQTCTNFLALFDIASNIFSTPILNYNINLQKIQTEKLGFIQMAKQLGHSIKEGIFAYEQSKIEEKKRKEEKIRKNVKKLKSKKKKVLLVSHPYNLYDPFLGQIIFQKLSKRDVEVLYSDAFEEKRCLEKSKELLKDLYWYESKINMGAICLAKDKIDGIIFLTTFPCGLDSLVNELAMRRLSLPYLNLVFDDSDAMAGMDTRIESFLDILEYQKI